MSSLFTSPTTILCGKRFADSYAICTEPGGHDGECVPYSYLTATWKLGNTFTPTKFAHGPLADGRNGR